MKSVCLFLYSVKFWLNMLRSKPRVCVCMCVRLSVCLCVSALQPKRLNRFQWNFAQMVSRTNISYVFLGFWNFEFDDVTAAILYFSVPALSRSQFCFDCLQILIQGRKLILFVCYWKSAKSVGKFCHNSGVKSEMETDPEHPEVAGSIPVSSTLFYFIFFTKLVTFILLIIFLFRFKINERNEQKEGC